MKNFKGLAMKWLRLNSDNIWHLPGETEENYEKAQ
jgi:hypothetical protein